MPDILDWPIYQVDQERSIFIKEINREVYENILAENPTPEDLRDLLSRTARLESQRIKKNPWKIDPPQEPVFWRKIQKLLNRVSQQEELRYEDYQRLLRPVINRYSEEIVSHFHPNLFRRMRRWTTYAFKVLFNSFSDGKFYRPYGTKKDLFKRLRITGHVEEVRNLIDKGTMVMLPTHQSNLDSLLLGYFIDMKAGLPVFTYGAGLNLYNYEIAAWFMNRLGPYRVDRRKKNPVYLKTLKITSEMFLRRGVNNLFFPGGTRSRSGEIEQKLKLGLLGSAIDAQFSINAEREDNKIFIVPAIISTPFTLEAPSLIRQHLRRQNPQAFLSILPPRTGWFYKILSFLRILGKDNFAYVSLGKPTDIFGNYLDKEGHSIDKAGRQLSVKSYFEKEGEFTADEQRESVYTKNLAEYISNSYLKYNVILPSQLLAHIAYKYWVSREEIIAIAVIPPKEFQIPLEEFRPVWNSAVEQVKAMRDREEVFLSEVFDELDNEKLLHQGLYFLGNYHHNRPLTCKRKTLLSEDLMTLSYYSNRLNPYGINPSDAG